MTIICTGNLSSDTNQWYFAPAWAFCIIKKIYNESLFIALISNSMAKSISSSVEFFPVEIRTVAAAVLKSRFIARSTEEMVVSPE
ncbi:MAG: hypothetical protein GZ094_24045 [Mariniphaga sp.]|nr:hypothetical protein [Mariniphaga sp.]